MRETRFPGNVTKGDSAPVLRGFRISAGFFLRHGPALKLIIIVGFVQLGAQRIFRSGAIASV